MKISLADQIEVLERLSEEGVCSGTPQKCLTATISTLKWVERHQAELRVLGEFPIEKIEVLTPQATGLSAIASGDEGGAE
jgi:hypothetical protein